GVEDQLNRVPVVRAQTGRRRPGAPASPSPAPSGTAAASSPGGWRRNRVKPGGTAGRSELLAREFLPFGIHCNPVGIEVPRTQRNIDPFHAAVRSLLG